MKTQKIPIDSVFVTRLPVPTDAGVEALAEHIANHGQKQPIIYDANRIVIDGERRIRALRQLGATEVIAIQSDDFDETCRLILKTRTHGVEALAVGTRRVFDLMNETHDQLKQRGLASRRRRKPADGSPRPPLERARVLLARALGLPTEAYLNAVVAVRRAFNGNEDAEYIAFVRKLITSMDLGEITPYEAKGQLERAARQQMNGDIVGVNAQRDALSVALSQLNGVMRGVARLGEIDPEFPPSELLKYITGIEGGMRDLRRFVDNLKRRAGTK